MTLPLTDHKAQIHTETLKTLDFLKEEIGVPPLFTCLHTAIFALSNIDAYCVKNNIERPESFQVFMKDLPKLTEALNDSIEQQYLYLNTEGSS